MLFIIGYIALFLIAVYYFLKSYYSYWEKRSVPNPPTSLLLGNITQSLFMTKSLGQIYDNIYQQYPTLPYVGYYKSIQPGVLIRDAELARTMLIKDFHDPGIHVNEKNDPIVGRHIFFLRGERWKKARSLLTPAFTTKKLKSMYPVTEQVSKKLLKYLNTKCDETNKKGGINAYELAARYTVDVTTNCAFGLEGQAFVEEDPEFLRMGKKVFEPSFGSAIRQFLVFTFPSMSNYLKVKLVPSDTADYFQKIVSQNMKYRKDSNDIRDDYFNTLIELEKSGKITLDDIVSHAFGFFADGFETSSRACSFILYCLAENVDVQAKVRNEINSVIGPGKKQFSDEELFKMTYLDQVMAESLRLYPPAVFITRVSTTTYTLPALNEYHKQSPINIKPGMSFVFPIISYHRDEKYFNNPDVFEPERFSMDKNLIKSAAYMPFGVGPRICIGQRFALMQIKVAIAHIVLNFEMEVNEKTQRPIEFDPAQVLLLAKGGIWLNFYKIN